MEGKNWREEVGGSTPWSIGRAPSEKVTPYGPWNWKVVGVGQFTGKLTGKLNAEIFDSIHFETHPSVAVSQWSISSSSSFPGKNIQIRRRLPSLEKCDCPMGKKFNLPWTLGVPIFTENPRHGMVLMNGVL